MYDNIFIQFMVGFLPGPHGVPVAKHVEEGHPYEIEAVTLHHLAMEGIHVLVQLKMLNRATLIFVQVT